MQSYIFYIQIYNVWSSELRFGTRHFNLQFRLFNGFVAKITELIIKKFMKTYVRNFLKEKGLVGKKYWSVKIVGR